jgi:hypothetical protein
MIDIHDPNVWTAIGTVSTEHVLPRQTTSAWRPFLPIRESARISPDKQKI